MTTIESLLAYAVLNTSLLLAGSISAVRGRICAMETALRIKEEQW